MGDKETRGHFSAFAFDIVKEAFMKSVREQNLAKESWAEHARLLLRDFTGGEPDQTMIDRIISR